MPTQSIFTSLENGGQGPLDSKTHFLTINEMTNLGDNNEKVFKYYEGMPAYCVENNTEYRWRERTTNETESSLLNQDYVYPDGAIYDDIDYSQRAFNFFLESINIPNYNFSLSGNNLVVSDGANVLSTINLSQFLDNTNLSRITNGSINTNGLLALTRDDNTQIEIDLSLLLDTNSIAAITNTISSGNQIGLFNDGNGTTVILRETICNLLLNNNNLIFTPENGTPITISLSQFLDNTNLPRLVSSTLNSTNGLLTLTRDDNTSFTVNLLPLINLVPEYTLSPVTSNIVNLLKDGQVISSLDLSTYLDDTNLARLVTGTLDPSTGILTVQRDDNTSFEINLSGLLNSAVSTLINVKTSGNAIGTFNSGVGQGNVIIRETITQLSKNNYNKLSFINEEENEFILQIKEYIEVNLQTLKTLISNNDLIDGLSYVITDFRNTYTQLETGIESNSTQGIADGLNTPFELIVVKAKNENELYEQAQSLRYPNDIIFYDINTDSVSSNGTGTITRRIDTKQNIRADYDFRTEQFRLGQMDAPLYDSSNTYSRYDFVKVPTLNGNGRFDYYLNISEPLFNTNEFVDEGSQDISNTKRWIKITENTVDISRTGRTFSKSYSSANFSYSNLEVTGSFNSITFRYAGTYESSHNADIQRGVVFLSSIVNSSVKKRLDSTNKVVVCHFQINNSNILTDSNSYIGSITNVNIDLINSFCRGLTNQIISNSNFKNDIATSFSEHIFYNKLINSYIGSLSINSNSLYQNTIISNRTNTVIYTDYYNSFIEFTYAHSSGSSQSALVRFLSDVRRVKIINVHFENTTFEGFLSDVYFQNTDSNITDIDNSYQNLFLRGCVFPSISNSIIKVNGLNSSTTSIQKGYSLIKFKTQAIFNSILNFVGGSSTVTNPKNDKILTLFYRDPVTKILKFYYSSVDSNSVVTYIEY